MSNIRLTRSALTLLFGALLAGANGAADAQSTTPSSSHPKPAQAPTAPTRMSVLSFETPGDSRVPLVSLSFDGQGPFLFGFDPGNPDSMIDKDFVKSEQFKTHQVTTQSKETVEAFVPDETVFQGPQPLKVPHVPFVVTDLYQLRTRQGATAPIVGIMGANFIRVYVERVDFSKKQIQFVEWIDGPALIKQAHPVTVQDGDGDFVVKGAVDGIPTSFPIDFMEQFTHLQAVNLVPKLKPVARVKTKSQEDGPEQIMRLHSLSVGDLVWKTPIVSHAEVEDEPQEAKNTLGADFFAHYYVTLDFHNHRLFLEPNPNYTEPASRSTGAGFTALPSSNGKLQVWALMTPSPASEAGLKVGDEILAINGLSIATTPPEQLHKASPHSAGSVLKLKIQRKGESAPRELTIKLRQYL